MVVQHYRSTAQIDGGCKPLSATAMCFSCMYLEWLVDHLDAHVLFQAPSWHGYFVLKLPADSKAYEYAMTAVESASHVAYQNHELRMCAAFTVLDSSTHGQASSDHPLLASARRPVLYWIPPLHEQHAVHDKPMVRELLWLLLTHGALNVLYHVGLGNMAVTHEARVKCFLH